MVIGDNMSPKKLIFLAVIISAALVIHYFESFIPVPAPGAKLGLANIMLLITLVLYGPSEAAIVLLVRSVLGSLLAGNPWSVIYSLSGGFLSLIVMVVLYYKFGNHVSLLGVSTLGSAFHNIGQLMAASIIFGTIGIFYTYLPVLMFFSIFTGTFTGIAAHFTVRGLIHENRPHGS
jgi:heptaprenyl diphosphate synthase